MRRIKNRDYAEIEQAVSNLQSIVDDMSDIGVDIKHQVEALIANYKQIDGKSMADLSEDLDEAKDKVRQLAEDMLVTFDDSISERSERWHESEVAGDVSSWREEWESLLVAMDTEVVTITAEEPFSVEITESIELPRQELY